VLVGGGARLLREVSCRRLVQKIRTKSVVPPLCRKRLQYQWTFSYRAVLHSLVVPIVSRPVS
jgi:hypothetical protein